MMEQDAERPPKIFISYSWSSEDHVAWVRELGEKLIADGVDVILDQWDLKPGQDKYKFMEQMVSDPSVTKVLLICDRKYAEKADGRMGGVGDETQIVSSEVYGSVTQTKFLPIVAEVDENGQPYKPAYIKARIHVNLSNPESYYEQYDSLLREIYGKPLITKPARGKAPAFLLADSQPLLKTTHKLQAFRNAVYGGKSNVVGFAENFLDQLEEDLEAYDLRKFAADKPDNDFEANVRGSLAASLPHRDEFVEFVGLAAQFGADARLFGAVHRFFARATKFIQPDNASMEPYRLLLPEMFLYTISALFSRSLLETAADFVARPYQSGPIQQQFGSREAYNFAVFCPCLPTLDRNMPAQYHFRRATRSVALLMERATRKDVTSSDLLNADYALYVRDMVCPDARAFYTWPAVLRSYIHFPEPMPFFWDARARSVFSRAKVFLGVDSKQDLVLRFEQYRQRILEEKKGRYVQDPTETDKTLMNLDELDTL